MRALLAIALLLILVAALGTPVHAHDPTEDGDALPDILRSATFDQHLGDQAPLDLSFTDETGHTVQLSDYFGEKPVILTLNYYDCDNLCPLMLEGVVRGLKPVSFTIGEEFNIVSISIDPRETPEIATEVKKRLSERYGREGTAREWPFLTGQQETIEQLARAVGFNYAWDEETQQYAHPSGVIILSPDGTIARYIYGLEFSPRDLRLALVEASEKKIASPVDQVLLFCFAYDPTTGKYGAIAMNLMRLGAAATVVVLGLVVVPMVRRERRQSNSPPGETE